MELVLLGTGGGPLPSPARFPSSQAIAVNGKLLVIDCGNGVAKQLNAAGLDARDMTHLLVTHHHVDHTADLGYLPIAAWIGGRTEPISVYGPPPTVGALDALIKGYAEDLAHRGRSTGRPSFDSLCRVRDIDQPGVVEESDGVRISCAFVDHPPFEIALAYRVDAGGRSVVVSGDTAPTAALVDLARGADVLVHEVVHPRILETAALGTNATTIEAHLRRNHTMVEDVGRIARAAGVGTLVLSHLIPHEGVHDEEWVNAIRPSFDGRIIVGRDLIRIRP